MVDLDETAERLAAATGQTPTRARMAIDAVLKDPEEIQQAMKRLAAALLSLGAAAGGGGDT